MSEHDPRKHETLLEAILTGEEDPRTAFARSELVDCTECRAELAQLVSLQEHFDATGVRERSDLAQLDEHAGEEGTGRALAALRVEIEATTGGSGTTSPARTEARFLWAGLLVAAALVLLWFVPILLRGRPDDGPVLGGTVRILHPVGDVEAYAPLEWEDVAPQGGEYRVTVQGWDALLGIWEALDESGPLADPRWPLPADSWNWEKRIRVDVYVYGPEDARAPVSEGWAEARLVSRD